MRSAVLSLILASGLATPLAAQVAVTHPGVAAGKLDEARMRDILLGRVTTWEDGSAIILILLEDPAAEAATRTVTGREHAQLVRGWKRLVYAGGGAMPIIRQSMPLALDELRRRPGALAVFSEAPQAEGVQVVGPIKP